MKILISAIAVASLLAYSPAAPAKSIEAFPPGATREICFTPGGTCEDEIAAAIGEAQIQILFQAYSFTSRKITTALIDAKNRGVRVFAILDKSQERESHSEMNDLMRSGIPVLIDDKPEIAHNKVIVVDGGTTITGSFNFTVSAQKRNAENVLIVRNDPGLATAYARNFIDRQHVSRPPKER